MGADARFQKFLESFYFQYGHASIADLGHVVVCLEGISELAATEAEDEQLWDGQARSSRYQDFSKSGFITPAEFDAEAAVVYGETAQKLLDGYKQIHAEMCARLPESLPCPADMKPEAYRRNIAARAFDVARYLLFFGIPTGVGQVTSIRTLERQIRRLKTSEYQELRELAGEIAAACASAPDCEWDGRTSEAVAPTLARHVEPDEHARKTREDLVQWTTQNLPAAQTGQSGPVELCRILDTPSDMVATLLYPVTDRPFRELYELARSWSPAQRNEVIEVSQASRTRRDELLRNFRSAPYAYDMVIDIGAYRDLHRHRRCQQFRQAFTTKLGFDTPKAVREAGLTGVYEAFVRDAHETFTRLPAPGSHYLLPLATRSRFLFKMDFAEAEYIARLRSGVKGHFSYREIAWQMKLKMEQVEPELGGLMEATPPWIEDPLQR